MIFGWCFSIHRCSDELFQMIWLACALQFQGLVKSFEASLVSTIKICVYAVQVWVIVFDDWRSCSLGNVRYGLALYAVALCWANAFNVSFLLLFYRKWRHWRQITSGWRTRTERWFVLSASCPNNPRSVFSRLLTDTGKHDVHRNTGPRKN